MKITLLVVGRTVDNNIIAGIKDYTQRVGHFVQFDMEVIPELKNAKKLSETQDTTMLLINRINHPCAEMHELFAKMLFDAIFEDGKQDGEESSDTMYSEKG